MSKHQLRFEGALLVPAVEGLCPSCSTAVWGSWVKDISRCVEKKYEVKVLGGLRKTCVGSDGITCPKYREKSQHTGRRGRRSPCSQRPRIPGSRRLRKPEGRGRRGQGLLGITIPGLGTVPCTPACYLGRVHGTTAAVTMTGCDSHIHVTRGRLGPPLAYRDFQKNGGK